MDSLSAIEFENLKREFVPYNIDGSTLLIHNFHQYKSLDEVVNILRKYGFIPVSQINNEVNWKTIVEMHKP